MSRVAVSGRAVPRTLKGSAIIANSNNTFSCGDPSDLMGGTYTTAVWIRTTSRAAFSTVCGKRHTGIGIFVNTVSGTNGDLISYDWAVTGIEDSGKFVADGFWHRAVQVWQNGVAGGTYTYVDGIRTKNAFTLTKTTDDQNFVIGVLPTDGFLFTNGGIADICISNFVWSDAQVLADYLKGVHPTLIHRWKLDDGSGNTAKDSVGTADGTAIAGNWSTTIVPKPFVRTANTSSRVAASGRVTP
jgi:hypothetical protein